MQAKKSEFDSNMFEDIKNLCVCCAQSVVVISQRYNEDPRMISKLFLEVYQKIDSELDQDK